MVLRTQADTSGSATKFQPGIDGAGMRGVTYKPPPRLHTFPWWAKVGLGGDSPPSTAAIWRPNAIGGLRPARRIRQLERADGIPKGEMTMAGRVTAAGQQLQLLSWAGASPTDALRRTFWLWYRRKQPIIKVLATGASLVA